MFRCHDNVHVKGQYSGVRSLFKCQDNVEVSRQ